MRYSSGTPAHCIESGQGSAAVNASDPAPFGLLATLAIHKVSRIGGHIIIRLCHLFTRYSFGAEPRPTYASSRLTVSFAITRVMTPCTMTA